MKSFNISQYLALISWSFNILRWKWSPNMCLFTAWNRIICPVLSMHPHPVSDRCEEPTSGASRLSLYENHVILSNAAANRSLSAFNSRALALLELMYLSCSSRVCYYWLFLFPFWLTFGLKNSSVSKLIFDLELRALWADFTELYIQCFSLSL